MRKIVPASVVFLASGLVSATVHAQSLVTELASTGTSDQAASGSSVYPSISLDGIWVAFESDAADLVSNDTNAKSDVFASGRISGTLLRVSVDSNGVEGNDASTSASISGDGRYVAFASIATNLVPNDFNSVKDVFVRDTLAGSTVRVSVDSSGGQSDDWSHAPVMSADGRYVAFASQASNLVLGETNGWVDVFVHDLTTGVTERVSVDSFGAEANAWSGGGSYPWRTTPISADGRFVAFASFASNLVVGDSNNKWDVFVRDRQAGTTVRASVSSTGVQGIMESYNPAISADGRFVAYESFAFNLVPGDTNNAQDVFVHDLLAGTTIRANLTAAGAQSSFEAREPALSADGRFISFESNAPDLVPSDLNGDSDVFVRDLSLGVNSLWSVNTALAQANQPSGGGTLSGDGLRAAFHSRASNLVTNDLNNSEDVFTRGPFFAQPVLYCTAKVNSMACLPVMAFIGVVSATQGSGFTLTGSNVMNSKPGLLMYSSAGQLAQPFQGGILCVHPPIRRSIGLNSGGSPMPNHDCTGVFSIDMNAYATGSLGGNPAAFLTAIGTVVDCQFWGRDPGYPPPANSALTAGLEYTIGS
ncbi:MAG TPA: hypothetical protein VK843_10410 [Planctomycetota bacterium]|nr:hypothetical protein [Planctomycetota bacterium]